MRLLCYILLCFLVSLAMNKQPDVETLGDLGVLHCGPSGFQFTIHLGSQETGSFPALVAWGKLDNWPQSVNEISPLLSAVTLGLSVLISRQNTKSHFQVQKHAAVLWPAVLSL